MCWVRLIGHVWSWAGATHRASAQIKAQINAQINPANMTLSQPLPEEMLVATRVTDCCLGEVARIFIEAIKMLEIPIK